MTRQIGLATGLVLVIIAIALGVGYWASRTQQPEPTTPPSLSGVPTNRTSNTNTMVNTNAATNASNVNSTTSPTPTNTAQQTTTFTLATVAEHATTIDCWLVIENKVYDVTEYIPEHPGGNRITQGCGKDATDLFTGKSALGRMHSAVARRALASYQIGTLQ